MTRGGGKKATAEITVQQTRVWIASLLREALGRRAAWEIEPRLQRKALAPELAALVSGAVVSLGPFFGPGSAQHFLAYAALAAAVI